VPQRKARKNNHLRNLPVDTPHPNKQAFSSASSLLILAQEISASTVYSDMVEHPLLESERDAEANEPDEREDVLKCQRIELLT